MQPPPLSRFRTSHPCDGGLAPIKRSVSVPLPPALATAVCVCPCGSASWGYFMKTESLWVAFGVWLRSRVVQGHPCSSLCPFPRPHGHRSTRSPAEALWVGSALHLGTSVCLSPGLLFLGRVPGAQSLAQPASLFEEWSEHLPRGCAVHAPPATREIPIPLHLHGHLFFPGFWLWVSPPSW